MTHRKDAHGRGSHIHLDDSLWLRKHFTLLVIAMVLVAIFPPLVIPLGIAAVFVVRARLKARRPPYRDEMLARGRRQF